MTASSSQDPRPADGDASGSASSTPSPKAGPKPSRPTQPPAGPSLNKPSTPPPPKQSSPPPAAPSTGKHAAEPSIGQLVADASIHLSNLVHSEIELAKLELRSTVKNAGTGAGLFAGALVILVFSLTFGFFALAEGIAAAGLDRWLAFLIVFVFQLALVGACVYLGIKKVKSVRAPERTIRTTKETVGYLTKSRR